MDRYIPTIYACASSWYTATQFFLGFFLYPSFSFTACLICMSNPSGRVYRNVTLPCSLLSHAIILSSPSPSFSFMSCLWFRKLTVMFCMYLSKCGIYKVMVSNHYIKCSWKCKRILYCSGIWICSKQRFFSVFSLKYKVLKWLQGLAEGAFNQEKWGCLDVTGLPGGSWSSQILGLQHGGPWKKVKMSGDTVWT